MFRLDSRLKVFLHREAVDGRKSINGLALLVEQGLGLDPFAPAAYVFSNRRRDRISIFCVTTRRPSSQACRSSMSACTLG